MKKALVLVADGSEEMELVITIDVLRRAEIEVTVAGVKGPEPVKCSRSVIITPDCSLSSVMENIYDVVILPGGIEGTDAFVKSELVGKLLKEQETYSRFIAAICAAPLALKAHNICLYKFITSYPELRETLLHDSSYQYKDKRVVVDENLITSRGPGTAIEFALTIVEKLMGEKVIPKLKQQCLFE